MKPKQPVNVIALGVCLAGHLSATPILQDGFDATTSSVAPPVNDESRNCKHGPNLRWAAAPTYSADMTDAGNRQFTTGVSAVNFTGIHAAISTSTGTGTGAAPIIVTSTDISYPTEN